MTTLVVVAICSGRSGAAHANEVNSNSVQASRMTDGTPPEGLAQPPGDAMENDAKPLPQDFASSQRISSF